MSDLIARLNAALEGRYRIERQLGEGGMATVHLADDLRHERKVALKVLKAEVAAVVGAKRFLAEIKTTANLQHPNILPLFDSGDADSFLFYVMPYVEGESLRERLDRERQFPVDEAVRIARDLAEALDYAHAHGVIHRDVKPANILLQAGKPVVSDFGIALALGASGAGRLTETGLSLGTPHYMSPEQATGDSSVGAAADIYALGCVLYEMLVGEPPYTGSTPQAVLGKIVTGDAPSARAERTSVPANVDAAIRRAMERIPADRFTAARDFGAALTDQGFQHGPMAQGVASPGRAGPWRWLTLAFASLAALFGAIAGWSLLRPEPSPRVGRFVIPLPQDIGLQTNGGSAVALSPDGSQVVFAGESGGVSRLWRRPLDELTATPIPGTEDARTPVFSPDGNAVAFISGGRLMIVSLTGAPPLTLVEEGVANGPSGLAWSQDGWLYFRPADQGVIGRVSVDGGGAWESVTAGSGQDLHPDAIPGGRGLLFTRAAEIFLLDLQSREERRLFEGGTARYAASGHIVYTSGDGTLQAVPFEADRLRVTGAARPLFGGVQTNASAGGQLALSRTGTLLYVEGTANQGLALAEVDLEGNRRLLPLAPRDYSRFGPIWSPDGQSVAFASFQQIYTYDTSLNTTPRQITFEGQNVAPVFSPDGRRIAFSSSRDGTRGFDLFVKDLAEDHPPRSLLDMDGFQLATQWVTDTVLVFESANERGVRDLWILDVSEPESPEARPYLTSEADLGHMVVSPDGRLAAYSSDESGRDEIYVRRFPDPGERTIVSRDGGTIAFWAPDGSTLYYGRSVGRQFFAARMRRDPVPSVLSTSALFAEPGLGVVPFPGAALHPAGDRLIFAVYADVGGTDDRTSEPGRLILVQNFFEELNRRAAIR